MQGLRRVFDEATIIAIREDYAGDTLTMKQISEKYGCSMSVLYAMRKDGLWPARMPGAIGVKHYRSAFAPIPPKVHDELLGT